MAKATTDARNKKIVSMFASVIRGMVFCLLPNSEKRRTTFLSILSQDLVPVFPNKVSEKSEVKFWCFGGWASYRGQSATTKETATIEWIDEFEDGAVFWDIGANVGVFSLYASATKKNLEIIGFEPSSANYAAFNRNIELNGVSEVVTAMPIALGAETKLDYFHMWTSEAGNSGGQLGYGTQKKFLKQGVLQFSAEDFMFQFGAKLPNYIKIDVDGIEKDIIIGAEKIIENESVKSIAVELTVESAEQVEVHDILVAHGFSLRHTQDTVQGRSSVKNYFYYR